MDIASLRKTIDGIDAAVLKLLARRVMLATEISRLKRVAGLPPVDSRREKHILARAARLARKPLTPAQARKFMQEVMNITRVAGKRILGKDRKR